MPTSTTETEFVASPPPAPELPADSLAPVLGEAAWNEQAEFDRLGLSHPEIGQTPLLPPREPLGARIASFMGQHHTLLFVLCVVLLWLISTLPPLFHNDAYSRGEVAPHDILAPHSAMLLDRQETAERQDRAASLVPPAYDTDPAALNKAISKLGLVVSTARRVVSSRAADIGALRVDQSTLGPVDVAKLAATRRESALIQELSRSLQEPLPPAVATRLLQVRSSNWGSVERAARDAVSAVYVGEQIRSDVDDDLDLARKRIAQAVKDSRTDLPLTDGDAAAAIALAQWVARQPNLVVDERATEKARREARQEVRPVFVQIEANTPLVKEGEVISDERWAQLQELDVVTPQLDWKLALSRFVLCSLLIALASSFLSYFHPRLLHRPTQLWLSAAVPLLFLLIFRLLQGLPHSDILSLPLAAMAAMLLTILLDARVGMLAGFVVATMCTLMSRSDLGLFLAAWLSAWTATLGVANITSRGQMVRAGAVLALVSGLLGALLGVSRNASTDEILSLVAWGTVWGVMSTGITAGLAMFLERPFGITTHLRLLELLSPDETVMRRMQVEAPGSYTHSMMVASLSEAAAKAIDAADPLLCRVGGLYHDIGKLRRPHCFIENQGSENIHDRLSPQLSALVILAHVKDGLELGRALRLPSPVLDIIAQHHGTGLIAYFYQRALQREAEARGVKAGDDIARVAPVTSATDENLFRYPGPRPQGKEAAIIMLADSIEASSRALPNPTPERLQEHIHNMIAQRLQEGELSECDLTLRDLQKIESTFAHVLRGVMHHRIEYPADANGRANPEPRREKRRRRNSTGRLPALTKAQISRANGHTNGNGKNGQANGANAPEEMAPADEISTSSAISATMKREAATKARR